MGPSWPEPLFLDRVPWDASDSPPLRARWLPGGGQSGARRAVPRLAEGGAAAEKRATVWPWPPLPPPGFPARALPAEAAGAGFGTVVCRAPCPSGGDPRMWSNGWGHGQRYPLSWLSSVIQLQRRRFPCPPPFSTKSAGLSPPQPDGMAAPNVTASATRALGRGGCGASAFGHRPAWRSSSSGLACF